MIYMDNAATSLQKPLQVEQAVLEALRTAGNPGRGAHEATLHASRLVYGARAAAAELFDAEDASRIAHINHGFTTFPAPSIFSAMTYMLVTPPTASFSVRP